jgi:hypothetical protein
MQAIREIIGTKPIVVPDPGGSGKPMVEAEEAV